MQGHRRLGFFWWLVVAFLFGGVMCVVYVYNTPVSFKTDTLQSPKSETAENVLEDIFQRNEKNVAAKLQRHGQIKNPAKVNNTSVRIKNTQYRIITKKAVKYSGRIFPRNATLPLTLTAPYIIHNNLLCSRFLQLLYVVVVQTAPANFERRKSLRQTWASETLFEKTNSKTVFFLGRAENQTIQDRIYKENEEHDDIVQGDFVDHYENLTLKTVLRIRWISENCMNARYVIKVDDDVFLNIFNVKENIFPILEKNRDQIVCSVLKGGMIIRAKNIEVAKWRLDDEHFKDLNQFPMPMCFGFAAIFTTSLAEKMFEMARSTPFLRLEDVYMTGVVTAKIDGLTWRNEGDKFLKSYSDTFFKLRDEGSDSVITGTTDNLEQAYKLWDLLQKVFKK